MGSMLLPVPLISLLKKRGVLLLLQMFKQVVLLKVKKKVTVRAFTVAEVQKLQGILELKNKAIFYHLLKAITMVSVIILDPETRVFFIMGIMISMRTTAFRQWLVMLEAVLVPMVFTQHPEMSTRKSL